MGSPWLLATFAGVILGMMALDLGLLQKKAHTVSFREAALWCLSWLTLAMLFAGAIWRADGSGRALQFLAGYLLELSLSIDNMFVFVMIFHYFAIESVYQSRVLHWGILGAIVMRFLFIFAGISLINAFHWMIYVFGLLLIFTGLKMAFQKDEGKDLAHNPALKLLKRFMPVTNRVNGEAFFERVNGVWHATPLFAALIIVEFSDVIFALDSIPAVLAVTRDTFIVYTSNVFAIMGLRSLYFLLAGLAGMFRFLKLGISLILCFVGVKMMVSGLYHVPIAASLGVIAVTLAASIAASWLIPERKQPS